ncbi:MAG: hypothetical protein KAW02_00450 [candidate division Zixibacteria bacterium]|nr:hypothetical protein [candidate division Zixibacteria bacterium]
MAIERVAEGLPLGMNHLVHAKVPSREGLAMRTLTLCLRISFRTPSFPLVFLTNGISHCGWSVTSPARGGATGKINIQIPDGLFVH